MLAKITVKEFPNEGWHDRLVFGAWFWVVRTDNGQKSGHARTELKARAKAEKAARKLASRPVDPPWIDYEIEV